MHCPSGVSKVVNLCVHCQPDHLQKRVNTAASVISSQSDQKPLQGWGGDAPTHRLSDSIRTASGSDETIAQVSSRICFIRTNRHLTIPRKKTKKKKTPSPIHPEGPEETRTGHRVWMRGCWMLTTGRAPVGWRQLQHPGELLTSRSQRLSRLPRVSTNTSVHRLHV